MAVTVIQNVVNEFMKRVARDEEDTLIKKEVQRKVVWKVIRETNQAYGWEYRVITRGWKVSPRQIAQRRTLAKICCYVRILERIFNEENRTKDERIHRQIWTSNISKALTGLTKLREFGEIEESRRLPGTTKADNENIQRAATATDEIERQREVTTKDSRMELYGLWMEFAITERIKNGWYDKMPSLGEGRCQCRRGRISYPHWPPTSVEEATEQFELCQDDNNEHRRSLVIQWWNHFNGFANMTEWKASEKQQRYKDAEKLIRESSIKVQQELERSTMVKKRPKGWGCREYCEPVLKEGRCSCLCHCEEHRDLCPTHS